MKLRARLGATPVCWQYERHGDAIERHDHASRDGDPACHGKRMMLTQPDRVGASIAAFFTELDVDLRRCGSGLFTASALLAGGRPREVVCSTIGLSW